MRIILLILLSFFMVLPAANAQNYGETYQQIQDLNIGNPANGQRFDRVDQVLKRKVQDRKSNVVGTLHDILLSPNGYVDSIQVEFDRLQKREKIDMNYSDAAIKAVPSAYILTLYSKEEVEELYPTLLANIQTAAGAEDIYSAKNIIGAVVRTDTGRVMGKVENVLFDNQGDRARALYVKMSGSNRSEIAMPFSIAKFDFANGRKDILISEEQAKALTDYARTR